MRRFLQAPPLFVLLIAMMVAALLTIQVPLSSQQNIVTMYGCLTGTNCTIQPVAVDSSGNMKASLSGNGSVPTGVATGSVLASNGVGVQGIWSATPTLTSLVLGSGSASIPALTVGQVGLGWYLGAANHLTIGNTAAAGGIPFDFGQGETINSGGQLSWSSTTSALGSGDVNLSRQGSGIIQVGGASADATGTITAATVNAGSHLQLGGIDIASASTCSNTAASSDITGTNTKTYFSLNCKVPANSLAAGDTIAFDARGVYSGNVTDTMTMTLEACQVPGCASGTKVTLATTGALTLTAVSNQGWEVDEHLVTFTTGTTGTIDTQGKAFYETAATTAVIDWTANTGTATVATNVDEYLSVSVTFSTASGSNHASIRNLIGVIQ